MNEECRPAWTTVLLSAAGLGVLSAATIVGEIQSGESSGRIWLDVLVGLVAAFAVPLLVRQPIVGGAVLSVLAALSPAATPAATAFVLVIAYYRRFPIALAVAGMGIVGHAVQGTWRPSGGIAYGWWLTLVLVAYAALVGWGAMTRARSLLLASLRERADRAESEQARRVAEAQLAERHRIAREMHDVLAHRLSLVATYAGALEYRPDASAEQRAEATSVVRAGVHEAMVELREIVGLLREDDRDEQRPQPVIEDIPRLVEESRDAGQQVSLEDRRQPGGEVSAIAGRTVYRVVQEGLTNARKHAPGEPVRIVIDGRPGEILTVELRNSLATQGFSVSGGAGLVGLTERVRLAGGSLDHELDSRGFRLSARLPA